MILTVTLTLTGGSIQILATEVVIRDQTVHVGLPPLGIGRLGGGVEYILTIDLGAFTDLSGNPIANTSFSFWTRLDSSPPVLVSSEPGMLQAGVNPNAVLRLFFDAPLEVRCEINRGGP